MAKKKKKDESSIEEHEELPQFMGGNLSQEELRRIKKELDTAYGEARLPYPRHSLLWKQQLERHVPVKLLPHGKERRDKQTQLSKFATIDIETQSWTNYVVGGIYFEDKKTGTEHFVYKDKLHDLMDNCFVFGDHNKIRSFVAHYGGKFDFLFFLQALIEMPGFYISNIIPRGSSILSFDAECDDNNAKRLDLSPKRKKITFRDSAALLPYALSQITKSFNVKTKKGEMDFLFIQDAYNNVDYLDKLLTHPKATVFFSRKQIKHLTRDMRDNRSRICYWNSERFPIFPFRGKKSFVKPYMLKVNKKGDIVENDWLEQVTFPLFKREDVIEYLKSDCKGLYESIDAFFNAPLIRDARKSWTTASQAVNVFRLFLKRNLHTLPDDVDYYVEGDVDEFVRRAYFGGRTEVFKPVFDSEILEKDWLYYADVNSLYPFVMEKHEYPDRFLGWRHGEEAFNRASKSIWHCRVRVPKNMYAPPLAIKHEERLVFPVGEFEGYWTNYEINYAKSIGVEVVHYYEGAIFENAGYIFKDFINDLYQRRLKAKEENDHVTQMTMKLLMNSCYGRMGINKMRSKIKFDDGFATVFTEIAEIFADGREYRLIEVPEKSNNLFSNPTIACFVTSYARVHLHQEMMKVGPEHVYYCDTDSIFTDKPMEFGKELGQMKLEYKCKSAVFLLPKTYINGDMEEEGKKKPIKTVMKGFDSKLVRNVFTKRDFVEYLFGLRGHIGASEQPRFATFKLALRQGAFVAMKNDPAVNKANDERKEKEYLTKTGKKKRFVKKEYKIAYKELKGIYSKRTIVDNGFDTKPLCLKL